MIQEWQCETIPDHKADLDTMDNPEQTELMIWAALQVKGHMDALENIPKN